MTSTLYPLEGAWSAHVMVQEELSDWLAVPGLWGLLEGGGVRVGCKEGRGISWSTGVKQFQWGRCDAESEGPRARPQEP